MFLIAIKFFCCKITVTFNRIFSGGFATSIVQTPDGGYIYAGFDTNDLLISAVYPFRDKFMDKNFGGNNALLWRCLYFNAKIISTSDNNFVILGQNSDTLNDGTDFYYFEDCKIWYNGNFIFIQNLTLYLTLIIYILCLFFETTDGGFLAVDDTSSNGNTLILFSKFNTSGKLSWQKGYSGNYSVNDVEKGWTILCGNRIKWWYCFHYESWWECKQTLVC